MILNQYKNRKKIMNKNKFSFQFLSSDRLHQINFSLSNFLIFFGVFIAALLVLNYSLSLRFSEDYYKVKLEETDQKYSEVSQELLDRITQLENELKLIEEKDEQIQKELYNKKVEEYNHRK